MRIVFICGSLEAGHDGVGDYTLRLCGEIQRQGHDAGIVAINDKNITSQFTGFLNSGGNTIPVLRLPSSLTVKTRFLEAGKWIEKFKPVWLSLQFVPFSFNNRGMPLGLGKRLARFGSNYRWHIMFHELWIGVEKGKYIKSALISSIQKFLINQLIVKIKPAVIHTHLPEFRMALQRYGLEVKNLPLFSNIDVGNNFLSPQLNDAIRVGFFSQAEAGKPIIDFLISVKRDALANAKGSRFELVFIGGKVNKMQKIGYEFENLEIFEKIRYTGFLKQKELSAELQACAIGVTPVPRHGLGKSGSVAAFLTHGIPVAAPNVYPKHSETEIGFDSKMLCSAIILKPQMKYISLAREGCIKAKEEISLSTVASKFLSDIG